MWKSIVILSLLITFSSCGSKKAVVNSEKNETAIESAESVDLAYKSLGNDLGSIYLQLFKNNTFKFKMKVFASEDDDSEKSTNIDAKGTYTNEGDWKTLKFKNPKFSLAAIFDKQFGDSSFFKVIDEETVKINTAKDALPIWGVVCEKQ
jgi:hypothetical protein